ncbi:hypothetical protein BDZ97DRAFT_1761499 [Flammula alnicola]|nr:hypothetical protein BDZ97DRAFT_1761499 [Flammula alnicola]
MENCYLPDHVYGSNHATVPPSWINHYRLPQPAIHIYPPPPMAPKKRKFSDLSVEQTSRIKGILLSCREECDQLGIDEEDEDVRELNRIIDKLTDAKHTPFSDVPLLTFCRMGIKIQPMEWRSDGETEAKTYANATLPGARTVEDTRKNIDDVLKYVSLESEAGCRILINVLLIHVASNLETHASGVVIAPEFRVEDMLLGSTENAFGGVVDYMLIYGDKVVRDRIIKSKAFAFSDPEIYKLLKCNIYEAKPEDLFTHNVSSSSGDGRYHQGAGPATENLSRLCY